MTTVGNFPSGGALSPDGRYYWAVNAGHGYNSVSVVNVETGAVAQDLPLPGGYGHVVFAPDGSKAYVSGEKMGIRGATGPTKADAGDAVHAYAIDAQGHATELDPIAMPATSGGTGRTHQVGAPNGPAYPTGLAITADGKTLVVALNEADKAVILNLATGTSTVASTGAYPLGVAIERSQQFAYVANEYDGSLTQIKLADGSTTTIPLGVPAAQLSDKNSHASAIIADPQRDRVYVAVSSRDLIAVVNTVTNAVERFVSVGRSQGLGTQPVALALSPDGSQLWVADSGEDALAVIALQDDAKDFIRAYELIGRVPTAWYPTGVALHGNTLIWLSAQGLGSGPNPGDNAAYFGSDQQLPLGKYTPETLIGTVGVSPALTVSQIRALTPVTDQIVRPENAGAPPQNTVVHGTQLADGLFDPSAQIKHVFLIVRENRTYDQIFGSDVRGDGAPALQLFEDNCRQTLRPVANRAHPGCGTTPNAHQLSRKFPLLDHVFADSDVSIDGHIITTGVYAIDYAKRAMHANYGARGRGLDHGIYPVTFPPKYFLFDAMAQQNISMAIYGEIFGGNILPVSDDGRATFPKVAAAFVPGYPDILTSSINCLTVVNNATAPVNGDACPSDAGLGYAANNLPSRVDVFNKTFQQQLTTSAVPQFSYLTLPHDHTAGALPNFLTPKANVADNDLALGQIVDLISHSAIWPQTAIFVVEDDAQDGPDSVDAHRMPAFVISPWTYRDGRVVHTRYDHYSVLRTIELMLGIAPLSLYDALATPMYDAFIPANVKPDVMAYTAEIPEQNLNEHNPGGLAAANAKLSLAMYVGLDLVPERINDQIAWQSVFGPRSTPPPPGPNYSRAEDGRAEAALKLYRTTKSPRRVQEWLKQAGTDD